VLDIVATAALRVLRCLCPCRRVKSTESADVDEEDAGGCGTEFGCVDATVMIGLRRFGLLSSIAVSETGEPEWFGRLIWRDGFLAGIWENGAVVVVGLTMMGGRRLGNFMIAAMVSLRDFASFRAAMSRERNALTFSCRAGQAFRLGLSRRSLRGCPCGRRTSVDMIKLDLDLCERPSSLHSGRSGRARVGAGVRGPFRMEEMASDILRLCSTSVSFAFVEDELV
jgi:hypothetical protein